MFGKLELFSLINNEFFRYTFANHFPNHVDTEKFINPTIKIVNGEYYNRITSSLPNTLIDVHP